MTTFFLPISDLERMRSDLRRKDPVKITITRYGIGAKTEDITLRPMSCDNCGYLTSTICKVDFEGHGGIWDEECADPEPVDHDVDEFGCEHWIPAEEDCSTFAAITCSMEDSE